MRFDILGAEAIHRLAQFDALAGNEKDGRPFAAIAVEFASDEDVGDGFVSRGAGADHLAAGVVDGRHDAEDRARRVLFKDAHAPDSVGVVDEEAVVFRTVDAQQLHLKLDDLGDVVALRVVPSGTVISTPSAGDGRSMS